MRNQDNSSEKFCYKGMERNEAGAGRCGVKGLLSVKTEKYQSIYCHGKDPVKSKRVGVKSKRVGLPWWRSG